MLQLDPTAATVPKADLVAQTRLGSSYSPAELTTALREQKLVELNAMIRPSEDMASSAQKGPTGLSVVSDATGRKAGSAGCMPTTRAAETSTG